jgi:hypothetical protein
MGRMPTDTAKMVMGTEKIISAMVRVTGVVPLIKGSKMRMSI